MLDKSNNKPLYIQIADTIRNDIETGVIRPGDKLDSESAMMRYFGVGRLTVRNALEILIKEGLLSKSQGKGTFCKTARVDPDRIDVLLDMSNTYFIPYYVKGISSVLRAKDCALNISDTSADASQLCRKLESELESGASGVIFQLATADLDEPVRQRIGRCLHKFHEKGIPCIMIDSMIDHPYVSYVIMDEREGAARAAEHLAAFRHTRCAVVYDPHYTDSMIRHDAFLAAAAQYGMEYTEALKNSDDLDRTLFAAVRDRLVTGVFCYNDMVALRCMRILQQNGLRIPADVSVIGYDDTPLASSTSPVLTTISHPKEEMGTVCAEALLDLISGKIEMPYRKVFHPRLISRESCALKKSMPRSEDPAAYPEN